MAGEEPLVAAIGAARCRSATGELDEAVRILTAAAQRDPKAAEPRAELAEIVFAKSH